MRDETREKPHLNNSRVWLPNNSHSSKRNKKGNIMKNLFAVNFAENTITASKTTLKKASVPNSPEYKALMKLMKQNPTFTIEEKKIKEATGKKTYEGLNKAFIEKYISIQSNADDLNKQYAKATEMGKFPLVRKWFLNTFKNFNLEEAKKEIEQDALRKISAASAEKQSKVVDMPAAANQ